MVNFLLGISISLNFMCIVGVFLYIKFKLLAKNSIFDNFMNFDNDDISKKEKDEMCVEDVNLYKDFFKS